MAAIYTSADQLIGKTPLLELSHIEKEEHLEARLLAKLEYFNTTGSVTSAKLLGRFRNAPSDGTVIYYKDMTFGGNIGTLPAVGLANGGSLVEGTMPE